MSDVAELKFWACCGDAIDWSQDGIIAFASEENVEMLFPNTEYYDKEQQVTSWQHTPLQIPWFTREELPPKYPAPYCNLSVGEEISPSLPISIAWSSPGLAKHRRCALGALTSGLVFSVWSADGKLDEESSWRRRVIVNDSLAKYFAGDAGREQSVLDSEEEEKMRLRSRIRCFVWAPTLPTAQASGSIGTQPEWGAHLIAMANDDNQVIFAVVKSPITTLGAEKDWSAKVLGHFSITPDADAISSEATTFDEFMQQQRFVSQIAWSPWVICDGQYQSILAYSTNEHVRARNLTYTHGTIEFGEEAVFAEIDIRNNGAMKWSPTVVDGDKLILAVFAHTGITCLTVSATDGSILSKAFNNPDGRYDENSGVVWDHPTDSLAHLHFSTFTTTMDNTASSMEVSESGTLSVRPTPSWRAQINDSRTLFSVQNELQGHAKSKIWGLCASPLGDFIAVCYTLHPSDMIEYGPPAARRSTIAVNGLRSFGQPSINFPAGNTSAEAVIYTIRKWLDNTVEVNQQVAGFTRQVLEQMLKVYEPGSAGDATNETPAYDSGDLGVLVHEFKCQAFLNPQSVKDRYTILMSLSCTPDTKLDLERALIAYRLAAATLNLPNSISRANSFSSEILSSHQQVVQLIQSLMEPPGATENDPSDSTKPSSLHPGVAIGDDTCDLCDAPIPFADLDTAACLNGHQFSRCGLSFLAIQAPRITKSCGLCETVFLSEEFVRAQEGLKSVKKGSAGGGGQETSEIGAGTENAVDVTDAMVIDGEEVRPAAEHADTVDIIRGEERLAGEEVDGNVDAQGKDWASPLSLAKILFLACDVCIYCGGKFVG